MLRKVSQLIIGSQNVAKMFLVTLLYTSFLALFHESLGCFRVLLNFCFLAICLFFITASNMNTFLFWQLTNAMLTLNNLYNG